MSESISITLKSHLPPTVPVEDFKLGKPFQVYVAAGTTLNEFLELMFPNNKEQIGFKVVNGQISFMNPVLNEEDEVEVYTLISGG